MSQKTGSKKILLHPIENHREASHPPKNSLASHAPSQTDAAVNTEQFSLNRDTGTNTPNYAEQIVNAMQNGSNAAEEIAQMLMEVEASESYWKLMTERRRKAIDETSAENQQLHELIDDLNKDNDQLRVLVNHCDYLQNVLEKLTTDNDSLLDETNGDDSPID